MGRPKELTEAERADLIARGYKHVEVWVLDWDNPKVREEIERECAVIRESDRRSVARAYQLFDAGLRSAGLGHLEAASCVSSEVPGQKGTVGEHHLGTTRMHREPTRVALFFEGVPNLQGSIAGPLPDGRVLVAGGHASTSYIQGEGGEFLGTVPTDAAQYYDPKANTWSDAPSLRRSTATAISAL